MKKILITLLVILIILLGVGFFGFKYLINSLNDQIAMQYDKEVLPKHKQALDYSAFENNINQDRLQEVTQLILGEHFDVVRQYVLSQRITCEELVIAYIERIKSLDGNYNSVLQLNPKALELARELDTKIKNGESVGTLAGGIVLIKDNIAEKNMNTAAGSYALKALTTTEDAFVVKELKDEDAIILGKCNLSEWSNFMSLPSSNGFSTLGGQTKNAYGKFDVGGSSSGSSVAAALNLATITLGSETSGSLIYPAGQNSVVAIKPTLGALSRQLIIPISEAQDTAGVVGTNVLDVYTFYKVAVGADEMDTLAKNATEILSNDMSQPLDTNYLQGKRIGLLKEDSHRAKQLRKELEAEGATVVEVTISDEGNDIDMMSVLNYGIVEDVRAFLNHPNVNAPFKSLQEIIDFNKEDPDNRMPYGASLHESALQTKSSKEDIDEIITKNRRTALELIETAMKENDIVAIASFSNDLSGIYAPAMCPALTVPAGYKENGEPYGVTFVSTLNKDLELFNIGYAYEQGTMHRKQPVISESK